jgi:hypothetical protein
MPYAALEDRKTELIRKALQGSVFVAEITATAIANLTSGAGGDLIALPTGYEDVGWLTEEGMAFSRETSSSDITSFGSTTPTRSDITADTTTLTIVMQETRLTSIGLGTGADTAAITAAATTKETRINKPERPSARNYRVLALAVDEDDQGDEIYIARFLPRAKVTAYAAQSFVSGDSAVTWGVTFTGYNDSALGYSESWIFGGPGWANQLAAMQIPDAV